MPQSAKALKLVGDVHASSTTGREKVFLLNSLCFERIMAMSLQNLFSFSLFNRQRSSMNQLLDWNRVTLELP